MRRAARQPSDTRLMRVFYRFFERLRGERPNAEPRWPARRMLIFTIVAALGLGSIAGRLWWEDRIPERPGAEAAASR